MEKYLEFIEETSSSGKTKICRLVSKRGGYLLGTIKWHSRWRQYVFFPENETLFSVGCMADICDKIYVISTERIELAKDKQ